MTIALAMDKSMRSYDANGHLIVERTIITKASVNPYFGKEIPNYEALGLEPDKIYNLLRDPEELKKALSSFKGVQLLIKHTPVNADEPHKDLTVGSVGTDVVMEGNDVYASLRVFDQEAISLIESGKLQELSAGYAYVPDMIEGEFNGQGYDGVMRQIHGNHVALVERGRIGRDAIISDHLTTELEQAMKLKQGGMEVVKTKLAQLIGMDGDITPEIVEGVIKTVSDNMLEPEKPAEDDDETKTDAEDEENGKDMEKAEDEETEDKKDKPAMDADAIEAAAVKRVTALFEARDAVKPLVGMVAMDSAEDVYKYALEHVGVSVAGVHPSAFKSMVGLVLKNQAKPETSSFAMDSAFIEDKLTARFK